MNTTSLELGRRPVVAVGHIGTIALIQRIRATENDLDSLYDNEWISDAECSRRAEHLVALRDAYWLELGARLRRFAFTLLMGVIGLAGLYTLYGGRG